MTQFWKIVLLAAAIAVPTAIAAQNATVRFAPIDAANYTAEQKEFARLMTEGPRAGNLTNAPFKVYFASPGFGLNAIKMSNYLRWGTGLDARLSELAIIIAARHWDSGYIWHAHYPLAVKGGLDPKIGAAIAEGKRPTGMKEDEQIVYDLLTEIYRDHDIKDATYARAKAKFGEKGIADIQGLAAYYGVTAMALITARATYPAGDEPKLVQLAQAFPR
jgi:4-carboxymuconolactone decarboxylase